MTGTVTRLGHRAGQLEVVAVLGAIPIHAGQKNLARALLDGFLGPGDGVTTCRAAAAVREPSHFVARPVERRLFARLGAWVACSRK
jgi:hypothetical protein